MQVGLQRLNSQALSSRQGAATAEQSADMPNESASLNMICAVSLSGFISVHGVLWLQLLSIYTYKY
jgi:hypothetical protein